MDGPLLLTRVVRQVSVAFETVNPQGDSSTVQVDCLAPELTPRALIGILCNDLLVLCRDLSDGRDPTSPVDLWAVLRMQTLPQPASIVHGNGRFLRCEANPSMSETAYPLALRIVDNKAILYFDAPSSSDALNWFRGMYQTRRDSRTSLNLSCSLFQQSTSISQLPNRRILVTFFLFLLLPLATFN